VIKPLVLIRGGGDLASGIAHGLAARGVGVVVTELAAPTMVRRRVSFGNAVYEGEVEIEGIKGVLCPCAKEAFVAVHAGHVAVLVDPACTSLPHLCPAVLVDARMAKRNLGTRKSDAPVVIGVGPGFFAGRDCHAVVESQRGAGLGKVIFSGAAAPNTGRPASVAGHTTDRVLRAPCEGVFEGVLEIGDEVKSGQVVGRLRPAAGNESVPGTPRGGGAATEVKSKISGVLRGLIADGAAVRAGQKLGDVDPTGERQRCFRISDKALTVGDGVIEALRRLAPEVLEKAWPAPIRQIMVQAGGIEYLRRRWPASSGAVNY